MANSAIINVICVENDVDSCIILSICFYFIKLRLIYGALAPFLRGQKPTTCKLEKLQLFTIIIMHMNHVDNLFVLFRYFSMRNGARSNALTLYTFFCFYIFLFYTFLKFFWRFTQHFKFTLISITVHLSGIFAQ